MQKTLQLIQFKTALKAVLIIQWKLHRFKSKQMLLHVLRFKTWNKHFILGDGIKIPLTLEHEVLGITIDTNLNFYSHLKQLCEKVTNKLHAFTRIIPYLDQKQKIFIILFFKGHLSYRPLIWTFYSRPSNNLFNKLQERTQKVVYNDYDSIFNELLEMANEKTIHTKNIQILMTDIHKFLNGLAPPMSEAFNKKDCPYSIRNPRSLITNCKSTVKYGIDSIV